MLERVINGGVMAGLASVRPMLSPMLWNSIATGKRPFKHGVCGFTEVDYELNSVIPVSTSSRKCKALWNILNEAGLRTHVIGWFATHPAETIDGVCVTDRFAASPPSPGELWPIPAGCVHPEDLSETLAELRVRPGRIAGRFAQAFRSRSRQRSIRNTTNGCISWRFIFPKRSPCTPPRPTRSNMNHGTSRPFTTVRSIGSAITSWNFTHRVVPVFLMRNSNSIARS